MRERVEHPVPGFPFWRYEAITNGETVLVALRHVSLPEPSGTIVASSSHEALNSIPTAIAEITESYPEIRAEDERLASLQ